MRVKKFFEMTPLEAIAMQYGKPEDKLRGNTLLSLQ